MSFTISRGKLETPVRAVIYGSEGIGKSTLASQLPDPLFIDIEGGTAQLDVARIDTPTSWTMLVEEVEYIRDHPDLCRTLIIDTADRAQALCEAALLQEAGVDSIEKVGGGYGKGYTALLEKYRKELLYRLDEVIVRGINVVLLAHAVMRKQESPEDPPFDRWELNLSKKLAPEIRAWSDLLLFCNYRVMAVEENGRTKAKGKAQRLMFANHRPTFDAKNRYGLPDEMPLGVDPLRDIFERKAKRQPVRDQINTDTPSDEIPVEDLAETALSAFQRHLSAEGLSEDKVIDYLRGRGKLAENGSLEDLADNYILQLDNNIKTLKREISKGGKKK